MDKNGKRTSNERDKFAAFYNSVYKSTIYAQGHVGDIKFYTDHYVKDNTIAVYYTDSFEEFLFEWNENFVQAKGVDSFLGHILINVEEQYEERVKNEELRKLEDKPKGNADMITMNPGAVSYADLKAYLDKKQKERYKNNESI